MIVQIIINFTDFVNGAKRAKLVERLRHLCELYDRPVLIIEKDRVKPGEMPSTKSL
jgi:ERCC4-type nuclease